jgi:hypothetical protein
MPQFQKPSAPPVPADPIAQLLTYRGFFGSDLYLPDEILLDEIDSYVPYFFPLYDSATSLPSGSIGPNQTDRGQIIAQEDSWLVSLIASASQGPASFSFQLYDTEREITFMEDDLFGSIAFGSASKQFFLKTPIPIPTGGQIESRVINLSASANAIQLVGYGVRPDMRTKVV